MAKYVTKGTFVMGKGADRKTIPAGSEVTEKDLGIDAESATRYVALGSLVEKASPADSKPQSGDK
jgi:hypothetical protein